MLYRGYFLFGALLIQLIMIIRVVQSRTSLGFHNNNGMTRRLTTSVVTLPSRNNNIPLVSFLQNNQSNYSNNYSTINTKNTQIYLASPNKTQQPQEIRQTLACINDITCTNNNQNNQNNKSYYETEQIIKKSRFIGIAKQCTSWKDAQEFIDCIKAEHPKSRHVCFGFVCGVNPVTERCSDDGEPTGTAGVPILSKVYYFENVYFFFLCVLENQLQYII